jgi:hypothetical protein
LRLKEFFEAVGYCLAHGIMEYWNVGISKIPPSAGMILKGSFSFIDFLVNTVLPVD